MSTSVSMEPSVEEDCAVSSKNDDTKSNSDTEKTTTNTTTDLMKQASKKDDDDDTSSSTCSTTKEGGPTTAATTTTTTRSNRTNTVEFDPTSPRIHVIPSRSDLTGEEKDDMWYHRLEKQAMMQGALKTAVDLAPSDDEARGLEQLTYQGGRESEIARARLYSCFMREQTRLQQRKQPLSYLQKEEILARVSCTMTRRWREEATERGHSDAVIVNSNYKRQVVSTIESTSKSEGGMLQIFMGWWGQNQAK